MKIRIWFVLLICSVLVACAARPTLPASELGAARSAVTSAEQAGARDFALPELQEARQILERAESARDREDYPAARRLAVEAETQARYAAFRARAAQADAMITELEQSNADLRAEIRQVTGGTANGGAQ